MPEPDLKQMRASIARESRRHGDPVVAEELRRTYAAARIEVFVRDVISTAPPLTAEQSAHIARLLFQAERTTP